MYNFNHLYYFYITAKSGGVCAAAKHLKISQPSLSAQLRKLEQVLDLRLFRKVGRRNELTQAGAVVNGFCRQMFEISEQMNELMSRRVPSAARRVYIGIGTEIDRSLFAEFVSFFFHRLNPAQRPRVTVVSGDHDQLADRLRFREIDVVFTQLAMNESELENLGKIEVPVMLACPSTWKVRPASPKEKPNLANDLKRIEDIDSAQWLLPTSGFKLRSEIDRFLEVNQIRGRVLLESDRADSLSRGVAEGFGLALLPSLYVAHEVRDKSVRLIGPPSGYWKYRVWLSCHAQNKDDTLIQSLFKAFIEIGSRVKESEVESSA